MATNRALLSRLEEPDSSNAREVKTSLTALIQDIRLNLQRLLNTTHGGSKTAPDYGLPDLTAVSRGEKSAKKVASEIRASILRFEPRISDVRVRLSDETAKNPFTLHFDIRGLIADGDRHVPVTLRSVIEASGEVQIKKA